MERQKQSTGKQSSSSKDRERQKSTTDDLAEGEDFDPNRQNGPANPKRSGAV